jgi:SAM-dependent methyltransferase
MALYDRLSAVYDRLFPTNPSTFPAIEALIPENAPRRLLDLGAATGGHLAGFKERGWEVLGIELNRAMVAKAREGVRVIEGSMLDAEALAGRYFGEGARCGAVLCLGNTLPHLRPETIAPFFSAIRRLTAPGCPFVVQMLNYANPAVGAGFVFPDIVSGDIVFSRRYEAGAGMDSLIFVTDLSLDGTVMTDRTELYPLPPAVLRNALAAAGFDRIDFFADWNRADFQEDRSLYLIAVAR